MKILDTFSRITRRSSPASRTSNAPALLIKETLRKMCEIDQRRLLELINGACMIVQKGINEEKDECGERK